jgi:ubiquinone/menaquinone biosynthesis C-methylase UbiE
MTCNTPAELMNLSRNFMGSRILLTGAELNIFDILNRTSLTVEEISGKLHTDIRATTILLDALASLGLLVKSNESYQCAPSLAPYLSNTDQNSIIPMILHASHLWDRWARLTDIVKGEGKSGADGASSFSGDELKAFIGAMQAVHGPRAGEVIQGINHDRSKVLLDLGGASGTYTIAFLKSSLEMKATLFDLPEVIELARERLEKEGMLNRVTLVAGDYLQDEIPQGHDLAFLSAVIHSNSPEQNLDLYKKVFRALIPGGRVIIRDHVMESNRTRPEAGAIFAVNMLVATEGGRTYTFDEIKEGLSQAGFNNIRLFNKSDRMDAIVEAGKP